MNLSEKFIRSITSQAKPSQAYGYYHKGERQRDKAGKKKDSQSEKKKTKDFSLKLIKNSC